MTIADPVNLRVDRLLTAAAREAYLGEYPGNVACVECGDEIDPRDGYKVEHQGSRGYVCPPCNLLDEPRR